jgi:hypothetical protein
MIPLGIMSFVEGLLGPKFGKFAKPLIYGVLGLLILLALWGGKCAYDKSVITKHDAKVEAATAKADLKANDHAAEQRRADDARLTQESQQLKEAQNGATTDLDRRLAFQRCLRLQQGARRDGKQPPSCSGLNVPTGSARAH